MKSTYLRPYTYSQPLHLDHYTEEQYTTHIISPFLLSPIVLIRRHFVINMDHSIRNTSNFAIFCVSFSFTKLRDVTSPQAIIGRAAKRMTTLINEQYSQTCPRPAQFCLSVTRDCTRDHYLAPGDQRPFYGIVRNGNQPCN